MPSVCYERVWRSRIFQCTTAPKQYTRDQDIYPLIGEYLARQIESTEIADYPAGNHLGATLRAWCTLPEAFFAQAWYEIIGRKPIL
jgi:hypothetical protein